MKIFIHIIVFGLICQFSLAQDYNLLKSLRAKGSVSAVAISPDGRYIAAGGSKHLTIWDLSNGKEAFNFPDEHIEGLVALEFSPNGKYLVSAGGYNSQENLKIWQLETGRKVMTLAGQEAISCVKFSADGKYLVSGGLDKKLILWDLQTGQSMRTFTGHQDYVKDVVFSPNGLFIASSGGSTNPKKGEIIVWQTTNGVIEQKIKPLGNEHPNIINSLDFNADGRRIISAGEDGSLKLWNWRTGTEVKNFTEPYTSLTKVRFSPNGKYFATAGRDNSIKLWDMESGKKVFAFLGHFKEVSSLAFSADNKYLVSGSSDNTVKLWQAIPYKKIIQAQVQDKIQTWQQKGKFEKTNDYQSRVNETTHAKQVQIFAQEVINQLANSIVDWKAQRSEYDADNETFKLTFRNMSPLYLKVSLEEAESFDRNLASLKYENQIFTLSQNEEFLPLHVEVFNPTNGKRYSFDSQEAIAFNAQDLSLNFGQVELNTVQQPVENQTITKFSGSSDVDSQLPKTKMKNPDAVAVIVGNARYQKTKNVDYAIRDARTMRSYLLDVMGYQAANIIYLENASYTDFKLVFGSKENPKGKLYNMVKPEKSDVFIYYSGHGAPGLNDKKAYFVPTECDPQYVELTGFETDVMYDNLAQLPAKSTVVLLDACFSGENIYKNISPIVIKSKGALGLKNGALMASSAADQVSGWYNEKGHGLFTYFFLKAIHNRNADQNKDNKLTLEEIYNFVSDNAEGVPYQARRLHGITQIPVLKGQNPQKVLIEY